MSNEPTVPDGKLTAQGSRLKAPKNLMKAFYITLAVSIGLIVGGFLVPPIGIIDGSVLTAVGLLLMFAVVGKIPEAIKAGRSVKIQKGDFTAEIEAEQSPMAHRKTQT